MQLQRLKMPIIFLYLISPYYNMTYRKYERYFSPISRKPFSTAGTFRGQGMVGQTSLTRPQINTPFRGAHAIGNGGCCGTYNREVVFNSCCNATPSNGQSNMNTKGFFASRIGYPTAVYNDDCKMSCKNRVLNKSCNVKIPNSTVQCGGVKDYSPLNLSQSSYLQNQNAKVMQQSWPRINGKRGQRRLRGPYTKTPNVAMSSSEYQKTQFLFKNATEECC